MDKEIIILFIIQYILFGLPLFILFFFHRKINIRNSYKITIGTFLLIINWISTIGIITYSNALKHNNSIIEELFPNGDYGNLVFLIPVLIGLGVLLFYFIRISLGKIDIKIYGDKFTSGDKLTGEINLKLKKDIKNSNLNVYLRGYQSVNTSINSTKGTTRKKKYEDKIIIKENTFFESNYIKNYSFNFDIPYLDKELGGAINVLEKEYDKEGLTYDQKQKTIQIANSFLKFIGADSGKEYLKLWKIEVRLEKEGIDLFNEKIVNVVRKLKS